VGRPAVFLDRDGVLVVPEFRDGRSFAPRTLDDLHFYPRAPAASARLRAAGFVLVVVTNQPDVGKGLIPLEVLEEMHNRLRCKMPVDAIMACRHTQAQDCRCRKPRPGMLTDAAAKLDIQLDASFMVGDRRSDIDAGQAAGCQTIFIDLDYQAEDAPENPDWIVRSIQEAVDCILA